VDLTALDKEVIPIEILQLVDQLETLLNRSWRIPFTSSLLVNEQECLRLLDQMRTAIPEEIRQARRALAERDRLIAQAQEESQRIIALAREQAMSSLDDREIMREAESRAAAIIAEAQEEARTLEHGAREYALQVLRDLSNELQRVVRQVNNGIERLQMEMGQERQQPLTQQQPGSPLPLRHTSE
jgi:cell division septum initiation protein DivIVA